MMNTRGRLMHCIDEAKAFAKLVKKHYPEETVKITDAIDEHGQRCYLVSCSDIEKMEELIYMIREKVVIKNDIYNDIHAV